MVGRERAPDRIHQGFLVEYLAMVFDEQDECVEDLWRQWDLIVGAEEDAPGWVDTEVSELIDVRLSVAQDWSPGQLRASAFRIFQKASAWAKYLMVGLGRV